MIHLHIAVINEPTLILKCFTTDDVVEAILSKIPQHKILLASDDDGKKGDGEILITQKSSRLIIAIKAGYFNLLWDSPKDFFLYVCDTYGEAYHLAFDLRESNSLSGKLCRL